MLASYKLSGKYIFISGFLFTSVLGTLSHFFYEWSGDSTFIGLVCPISESAWEHMKLLFFPALLYCFLFKLIYKNAVSKRIFTTFIRHSDRNDTYPCFLLYLLRHTRLYSCLDRYCYFLPLYRNHFFNGIQII